MNKIRTIIHKEWTELFKNRILIFTLIFLPLLFTALPLIVLQSTQSMVSSDMTGTLPAEMMGQCTADMTAGECTQLYLVTEFLLLYMLLPLIIPINIAAYSIVGEKTNHSLEPLLATPISTLELLIGKNLAAVIPAVAATWLGFVVFLVGSQILVSDPVILSAFHHPMWLFAVAVIGPLLAILAVNFAIIVSSRVNDIRVAEQISTVIILPVILLFFGQMIGWITLNSILTLFIAAGLAVLDGLILFFTVQWFEREIILTRWS